MKSGVYYYTAFGLTICSDIFIMEFQAKKKLESYDIRIIAQKPVTAHPQYRDACYSFDISKQKACLYFSGVGEFIIYSGQEIRITPTKNATHRVVELYLSGVVFAVLLFMRGFLVYHGSCIGNSQNNNAVALVGESGAGKSTLAALMQKRGYTFLTDDTTALKVSNKEAAIRVMPAFPKIKISQETARVMSVKEGCLLEVQKGEGKYYLPVKNESYAEQEYNLKAICFLELGDKVSVEELTARQIMMMSVRYTMPTRLLQQTGCNSHFQQCAQVASTVSAYQLTRTPSFSDAQATADAVEKIICFF